MTKTLTKTKTLFTSIPLDETIDTCVKKLFKTRDTLIKGISKNDFRDLLNLATKELFFTFDNKSYIQGRLILTGQLSLCSAFLYGL